MHQVSNIKRSTCRRAVDGAVERLQCEGGAARTEHGGNASDEEGRVADDEAVGPRLVGHPACRHPRERAEHPDDGKEEGGVGARHAVNDGVVGQVDVRHVEP